MAISLKYNAPFSLSFALVAAVALLMSTLGIPVIPSLFTLPPAAAVNWLDPLQYFRMVGHAIGHADWGHYLGNFSFILILGPILEEKYSSTFLLIMCVITAFLTGLIHSLLPFSSGLLGASGLVFMMIVLVSFTNIKAGEIPITFIAVVVVYLGKEILNAFSPDQVSQFAHIVGGLVGGAFGFLVQKMGSKDVAPKN